MPCVQSAHRRDQADLAVRERRAGLGEARVRAVLGRYPDLSATDVAERTAMDKVAVSRAVTSLLAEIANAAHCPAIAGGNLSSGNGAGVLTTNESLSFTN